MLTAILFYAAIIVGFGLWIFWRFISNNLYNQYVLYGVMGGVVIADLVLLIFTYNKLSVITAVAMGATVLFSLLSNTGFLARSANFRQALDERRLYIEFWQDMVIDLAYAFLILQVLALLKSTI